MKNTEKIITIFFVFSVLFSVYIAVATWQWLPEGEYEKVAGVPFGVIANVPQTFINAVAILLPFLLLWALVRIKKW